MAASEELGPLMAEFGKAYTRRLFTETGRAGTTPARARLLLALQCGGSATMSSLSEQLDVTPRSITKLVDGLEAEGLVVREQHPHDRRATLIRTTAAGILVAKESAMANHTAVVSLFDQVSLTDRRHLARILRQLIELLGSDSTTPCDPAAR